MTQTVVKRVIRAPIETVFRTISEIGEFSKAVPDIVEVEFVSEMHHGVGAIFNETREIRGRRSTVELEVVEFSANARVRIVADTQGTIWDSVYTVSSENGATHLVLTMHARPHKLAARLTIPLIKGMVQKALEKDMDAVKTYCENLAHQSDQPE